MTQPSPTPAAAGDASSSAAASSGAASSGAAASGVPAPDVPASAGADDPTVRDARLAWIIGGSLLIARAALTLIMSGSPVLGFPGAGFVLDGLWAAALSVFAFGVRGHGSVVARRPLGVVALVTAAAVPLLTDAMWSVGPSIAGDPTWAFALGNGPIVLSLGALIVATVVIGRAGVLPPRLRWVPLIVLAVSAGAKIVMSIVAVSLADNLVRPDVTAAYFFAGTLGTLGVLLLGILAIVFAPREAPKPAPPMQVYPPAS